MRKIIHTHQAPEPIGPYSQAIRVDNTTYLSGQIALHPKTGELILDSISAETHQVMKNIGAILNAADMTYSDITKCTIFLSDMHYFQEMNDIYSTYFTGNYPARETIEVSKLPKDVHLEISAIAIK